MAAKKGSGLTPMMEQYTGIRRSLPDDVLLLFRLGDFYELFFEDAQEAAGILEVALTQRNGIPMCGVPHHAAEGYLGKLIQAGKRVALAEQTSEPQPGKIVEREVSQVISAGTISDLNLLSSSQPNYLAAITREGTTYGLAYVDHTTGDFRLTEFADVGELRDELSRIRPSELLVREDQKDEFGDDARVQELDRYAFLIDQARHSLCQHFRVQSLDGFGCSDCDAAVGAAGAVLHYLCSQMRRKVNHLRRLTVYTLESQVQIDEASQINLELVQSRAGAKHTLLHVLDRTKTPMGARKLRDWVMHPSQDLGVLQGRQDFIARFLERPLLLQESQEGLRHIRDVERITGRLSAGSGGPRDLLSLAIGLQQVPAVAAQIQE
ncbi:MAG: DNA mismatch repair protein MutS, partial [Verrucomicrobiota bacterium]